MFDTNLVLVLSIGALLVANGLIARAAAAKRAASGGSETGDPQ